ncbi:hypothetical protein MBAV_006193 [Candidatus Magnetobacterium bavaricum]|uniref:Uncharacterized protein n=1 Tax=Candidatus Magnetobacterium bavaricum TaxID=29290 RepID=A0A0F3GI44_9BACT|nr:hypothetical protein MBAV_006193 [Candidatus Magnetobacterium bavaricum]
MWDIKAGIVVLPIAVLSVSSELCGIIKGMLHNPVNSLKIFQGVKKLFHSL